MHIYEIILHLEYSIIHQNIYNKKFFISNSEKHFYFIFYNIKQLKIITIKGKVMEAPVSKCGNLHPCFCHASVCLGGRSRNEGNVFVSGKPIRTSSSTGGSRNMIMKTPLSLPTQSPLTIMRTPHQVKRRRSRKLSFVLIFQACGRRYFSPKTVNRTLQSQPSAQISEGQTETTQSHMKAGFIGPNRNQLNFMGEEPNSRQ